MDLQVFIVKLQTSDEDYLKNEYENLLCRLDDYRRSKAEKVAQDKPRLGSLVAGLLIQYAAWVYLRNGIDRGVHIINMSIDQLLEKLPLNPIDITYNIGENGKPEWSLDCEFNISHSGKYIAMAVSSQKVGIDIQLQNELDYIKLAKRFFSQAEYERIIEIDNAASENTSLKAVKNCFYKYWCRKEAYGKAIGVGLPACIGTDLSFACKDDTICEYTVAEQKYLFYECNIDEYRLCVCSFGDRSKL